MVHSAIGNLAVLVTEFTYVAQVNQRLAYNRLDEISAFYTAKSALKLSLLRLKAYKQVLGAIGSNPSISGMVPPQLIEQIWRFPFVYPLPTELPGLTSGDKTSIEKFQAASGIAGTFSAEIASESSKFNINLILESFHKVQPPQQQPNQPNQGQPNQPNQAQPQTPVFNPETARRNLVQIFSNILQSKVQADEDFAAEYRDFRIEDLTENIIAWADPTYESRSNFREFEKQRKGAPFYSLTELHMIPPMDERLYDLFSRSITANLSNSININTLEDQMLKALVPEMTDEERKKFFEFRDDPIKGKRFTKGDEFFDYLGREVAYFVGGGTTALQNYKNELSQRNIRLITDETEFRITVRAQVNRATKVLEAWVSLTDSSTGPTTQPGRVPHGSPL